jgi:hypothetical protein
MASLAVMVEEVEELEVEEAGVGGVEGCSSNWCASIL